MASLANMRFWYVTVLDNMKTVYHKQFLTVAECNKVLAEKKEEYKGTGFSVFRENF